MASIFFVLIRMRIALRLLLGGPWVVLGHYLVVQCWNPTFRAASHVITSAVVWARFPGMPMHMYPKSLLTTVANQLGRPIRISYSTTKASRGKFASVAIEVDFQKPLVGRVELDGEWERIEYEGLPHLSFSCGRVGHNLQVCPYNKEGETESNPANDHVQDGNQSVPHGDDQHKSNGRYGPWIHAPRRPRRQPTKGKNSGDRKIFGSKGNEKGKEVEGSKKDKENNEKKEASGSPFQILADSENGKDEGIMDNE